MKTIDYCELLKKYIIHVRQSEGADFITNGMYAPDVKFTQVEWETLKALATYEIEDLENEAE